MKATATVDANTDVADAGQKDQLRRELLEKLDSVAARLHRETEALSTGLTAEI